MVAALTIAITIPSASALSGDWTWDGFCGVMDTDGKTTAGDFICTADIFEMKNAILRLQQEVPYYFGVNADAIMSLNERLIPLEGAELEQKPQLDTYTIVSEDQFNYSSPDWIEYPTYSLSCDEGDKVLSGGQKFEVVTDIYERGHGPINIISSYQNGTDTWVWQYQNGGSDNGIQHSVICLDTSR